MEIYGLKVLKIQEAPSTAKFLLYFNKYENNKLTPASINSTAVNKNILIVENNEINMQIACSMLKKLGYNFLSAYNGESSTKNIGNHVCGFNTHGYTKCQS